MRTPSRVLIEASEIEDRIFRYPRFNPPTGRESHCLPNALRQAISLCRSRV